MMNYWPRGNHRLFISSHCKLAISITSIVLLVIYLSKFFEKCLQEGRKDVICLYFDVVKDNNKQSVTAKFKKWKVIMAGLVLRVKKHIQIQKCVPSDLTISTISNIGKCLKHVLNSDGLQQIV